MDVGERHAGAALGEHLRHREPEPGGRAGHDDAGSANVEELREDVRRARPSPRDRITAPAAPQAGRRRIGTCGSRSSRERCRSRSSCRTSTRRCARTSTTTASARGTSTSSTPATCRGCTRPGSRSSARGGSLWRRSARCSGSSSSRSTTTASTPGSSPSTAPASTTSASPWRTTRARSRSWRPRPRRAPRRHLQRRHVLLPLHRPRPRRRHRDLRRRSRPRTSSRTPSTRRPPMSVSADRPFSVGQVVWTPTDDARENSLLARYLALARAAAGLTSDYDELWRWSRVRPRGLLGVGLGLLRDPGDDAVRAGARSRDDARRRVVPGRAAELCGAHARPRRGRSTRSAVLARSQSRDPFDLTFGDLRDQVARARAGLQRLGVGPGDRVVAYLPNIPETLSPSWPQPASARSGRPARPSSGRAACSTGSASSSRPCCSPSTATAGARRAIDRREQVAEVRAGLPSLRTRRPRPVRTATSFPDAVPWDELVGRARAARVRPGSVRPPALRALLVGHDRPAEGDRPRPRRDPARAPEEPRPLVGPAPGRPADVVHDDGVDDVERARLGAPAARVDRDARRQPRLSRPRRRSGGWSRRRRRRCSGSARRSRWPAARRDSSRAATSTSRR